MLNMSTKENTLLGLDLFNSKIRESFILNIPHSSINIPELTGFNPNLISSELLKLTDWETDKIFDIPNISRIVADFSRLFCDVERFDDNIETMIAYGRGIFYTKTDNGEELRQNIDNIKEYIYNYYYLTYYDKLNKLIDEKLESCSIVHIIDCHSFSDRPLNTDFDKTIPRPDICIGTTEYHTPKYLIDFVTNHFNHNGYTVGTNKPYIGSMVPTKYYNINNKVKSIMIEINKRLYMHDEHVNLNEIIVLNKVLKSLFDN